MKPNKIKIAQIGLIALLVTGITILHYRTGAMHITSHLLFRELYFLPIILAGFQYGLRGGLTVSLAVTLLYLPYIFSLPEGLAGHNLGNIMQVLLFNVIGLLIGWLRDREKREQRKAMEAECLAAMGRAVSCIAHDMRTPLTAIGGFVRQVQRKISDDRLAGKLDFAFGQVQRLEVLVGDMLAFARPLSLQCESGPIDRFLEEIATLAAEQAAQHRVELRTELQRDIPPIPFDPHRLQQAVLNLVNNALEASPPGTEVTIRYGSRDNSVFIEIADQGEGIPEERRHDIFTPFMTTKKNGTGLGLPIVKKVIEAHGGTIAVLKNKPKGTIFRIVLPKT